MSYRWGRGDERHSEISDPANIHVGNSARVVDFRQVSRLRAGSQNARRAEYVSARSDHAKESNILSLCGDRAAERRDHFKKSNILTSSEKAVIPAVFDPNENLRIDERISAGRPQ